MKQKNIREKKIIRILSMNKTEREKIKKDHFKIINHSQLFQIDFQSNEIF